MRPLDGTAKACLIGFACYAIALTAAAALTPILALDLGATWLHVLIGGFGCCGWLTAARHYRQRADLERL